MLNILIEPSVKAKQYNSFPLLILVHNHECTQMHTCSHMHTCTWPCPCPNSPSIVRGSNEVDQLQLRHPFTLPPSLSPNPSSCLTTRPSFLPPDIEAWGSHWGGRMAGCTMIRRTDRQRDKDQTCRQEDAVATVDFSSHPVQQGE